MKLPASELADRIGWVFEAPGLLTEALTHTTYANERPDGGPHYERLEFLGDAALNLLVTEILFGLPSRDSEGEMSRRRARVVRREQLVALAEDIGLANFLRMGVGQERSGETDNILADAFEAVVGAVFADGGYGAVRSCFREQLAAAVEAAQEILDYKTELQQICHRLQLDPPRYVVLNSEGPDHSKLFRCSVSISGEDLGEGEARSKKAAQQVCARKAYETLMERIHDQ